MCKKFIKIISAALMVSSLCTSTAFAKESSTNIKDNDLDNISNIHTNNLSNEEKLYFIDSRQYDKKVTMSELDLYKKIDDQKNISCKDDNSMVKKYLNSIKQLGTKDNEELKDLGYSDQKVKDLKVAAELLTNNSDQLEQITTSQLLENVASQVTIKTSLDGYSHDTAVDPNSGKFKTLINLLFYWHWTEAPIVQNTDGFGVGFNANNKLQIYSVNSGVSYYNNFDNSYYGYTDFSSQATSSFSSKKNAFYFNYPVSTGKNLKKKTALSGSTFLTLVNKDSYVDEFSINSIYGHSTAATIPQFSLTNDGISVTSAYNAVSSLSTTSQHYKISDYNPIP